MQLANKFSTTDRKTAEKIALQLWERIQEKRPKLATKIKARRAWGTATKDKTLATKIALKLWKQMQHENPQLAAKMLTDNRPTPKDHWIAQICIGGRHHHIGSFNTHDEAMAAYAKDFEKAFGYPPGYNVQSIPKLDKVWPSWQEEKSRLAAMNPKPVMPVIGLTHQAKPLLPVIKRMQKVDWIVKNCMVVVDDSTPSAGQDIAIESRGQQWYGEIKQQGIRMHLPMSGRGLGFNLRPMTALKPRRYSRSFSVNTPALSRTANSAHSSGVSRHGERCMARPGRYSSLRYMNLAYGGVQTLPV